MGKSNWPPLHLQLEMLPPLGRPPRLVPDAINAIFTTTTGVNFIPPNGSKWIQMALHWGWFIIGITMVYHNHPWINLINSGPLWLMNWGGHPTKKTTIDVKLEPPN